jgi:hypothetical protein
MFICICVFNFRFFGIAEIWFLKTESTGAHVPMSLFDIFDDKKLKKV